MNPRNHPADDFEAASWHILGELELAVDAIAGDGAHAWLRQILDPLNLRADFLNNILTSAQQATARAVQAESLRTPEHIHLIVLVPSRPILSKHNWGFFRVEKIENTAKGNVDPEHTIEFYLYVDGG